MGCDARGIIALDGCVDCSSLAGRGGGGYLVCATWVGELESLGEAVVAGGDSGGDRWVGGGDRDEEE